MTVLSYSDVSITIVGYLLTVIRLHLNCAISVIMDVHNSERCY